LKTGQRKILVRGGYFGRFVPSADGRAGFLVYVRDGALFGAPFDPVREELRGAPVPLLDDVAGDPVTGFGHFDFSATGTLVYRSGKTVNSGRRLMWLDSSGTMQPLLAKPDWYGGPRFSPDGQRLALGIASGDGADIFVYDWQRDTRLRLTSDGQLHLSATWTPDGKHLVFGSRSASGSSIDWARADGAQPPRALVKGSGLMFPRSLFSRRPAIGVLGQRSSDWVGHLDRADRHQRSRSSQAGERRAVPANAVRRGVTGVLS
jgi:dipeptidyl aminopeptidase/acylaminoacyl peptidase